MIELNLEFWEEKIVLTANFSMKSLLLASSFIMQCKKPRRWLQGKKLGILNSHCQEDGGNTLLLASQEAWFLFPMENTKLPLQRRIRQWQLKPGRTEILQWALSLPASMERSLTHLRRQIC